MLKKTDNVTFGAFLLTVFIAGSNFVAVKYSNEGLAPFWGAGLRFFTASFVLIIAVLVFRIPLPRDKALKGSLVYGLLTFGLAYALLYWALLTVPAGIASITISLVPLFTFFFAILHRLEKFNKNIQAGSMIAILGIIIIFKSQISSNISALSLVALVIASVAIAEAGVVAKLLPKIHPVSINAVGMFAGSIILFIASFIANEVRGLPGELNTLIALIYLVFVGTIALFLLFIFVIRRWSATATSYQLVLAPLVTMVLANYLRGESVSLSSVTGSIVVILGVYWGALFSLHNK